jgi:hypothetical protein
MEKAAEHLRAKAAAAASAASASSTSSASAAGAGAAANPVVPNSPVKTVQARSGRTVRINKPMEAPGSRGEPQMRRVTNSPIQAATLTPTAEKIAELLKTKSDDAEQPPKKQAAKGKTVPVTKPAKVQPAKAPNTKQTAKVAGSASGTGRDAAKPAAANAPAPGQTKEGLSFEKKMRRANKELCRSMPQKIADLNQQTLCDIFSGPELSRLCGLDNE